MRATIALALTLVLGTAAPATAQKLRQAELVAGLRGLVGKSRATTLRRAKQLGSALSRMSVAEREVAVEDRLFMGRLLFKAIPYFLMHDPAVGAPPPLKDGELIASQWIRTAEDHLVIEVSRNLGGGVLLDRGYTYDEHGVSYANTELHLDIDGGRLSGVNWARFGQGVNVVTKEQGRETIRTIVDGQIVRTQAHGGGKRAVNRRYRRDHTLGQAEIHERVRGLVGKSQSATLGRVKRLGSALERMSIEERELALGYAVEMRTLVEQVKLVAYGDVMGERPLTAKHGELTTTLWPGPEDVLNILVARDLGDGSWLHRLYTFDTASVHTSHVSTELRLATGDGLAVGNGVGWTGEPGVNVLTSEQGRVRIRRIVGGEVADTQALLGDRPAVSRRYGEREE